LAMNRRTAANNTIFSRMPLLWTIVLILAALTVNHLPPLSCYAQNAAKVQEIATKILDEPGCPVTIKSARAELEIDPFQTPVAMRLYLEYQNDSSQVVQAVKFRVAPQNARASPAKTYQASFAGNLSPAQSASQQLRREGVDPKVEVAQVCVLEIKFANGELWRSKYMEAEGQVAN
jgi:hypothetical protein